MKESIILAVDGGATKTTLTIRSTTGKCLFEKTASSSNYQTIGVNPVIEVLTHLLQEAYFSTQIANIHVAVFAVAGIDTASDLETVTRIIHLSLQNTPFTINKLIIENDVQASLLGLVGHHCGGLVISGTGSIAFATDGSGNVVRAGGWGHRASDEGSGYWIGQQILKALFRAEDGLDEPTVLTKLVFEKLHIHAMDQLMNWLYQPDYTNAQTASLSSVLPKAVSLDDEKALEISQGAARELFLLVKATLTKLRYEGGPFTLYLNGGILKNHPLLLNQLQQFIRYSYPNISFVLCGANPIEAIVERGKYALT